MSPVTLDFFGPRSPALPSGSRKSAAFWAWALLVGCVLVSMLVPARPARAAEFDRSQLPGALSEDVVRSVRELSEKSLGRRRLALLNLGDAGPRARKAVGSIRPYLADNHPMVRGCAARAMWMITQQADEAVPVLQALLVPERPSECALGTYLLGEIGPPAASAIPALQRCLVSHDVVLRLHAAEALAKIDPTASSAHNVLLQMLHEGQGEDRYFAVCALLSTEHCLSPEIDRALCQAATDDDLKVASAAAFSGALRRLEAPVDNPAALSAKLKAKLRDPDPAVRRHAAEAVARIPGVAGLLGAELQETLSDEDRLVRVWGATALWRRDQDAELVISTVIDLLGTAPPNVTTLAVALLAEMGLGGGDALPTLHDLRETSEPLRAVQVAATICQIDIRDRDTAAILGRTLQSEDSDLRYLAALALGEMPLPLLKRAERDLTEALNDPNLRVRSAARRSLACLRNTVMQARIDAAAASRERKDLWPAKERKRSEPPASREEAVVPGAYEESETADEVPPLVKISDSEVSTPEVPPAAESIEEPALPELKAPQQPEHHPGWYDRDEETIEQHKAIGQLRARITPPAGDMPTDHATAHFAMQPTLLHGYGTTRGFAATNWSWEPTALCYGPLWFQDINLERYGWHYGCCQTAVSSVKFVTDVALLPYKLCAESPCDCYYTLGYDRPGNCVPYRYYRLPWRVDAALVLGGVATGLIFLAP